MLRVVQDVELVELGLKQLLVGQASLIFSHQRGGQHAAERVFDHLAILGGAEQEADGRIFVDLADIAIERFEVELQLAQVFRLEATHLQFDGDQAVQLPVKEEQVQGEVAPADLHGVFRADETEVTAQLSEKAPEVAHQGAVEVDFGVTVRQTEEFEEVRVLEDRF